MIIIPLTSLPSTYPLTASIYKTGSKQDMTPSNITAPDSTLHNKINIYIYMTQPQVGCLKIEDDKSERFIPHVV